MFTPEGRLRHPWGFHNSISWHQNDWLIQVGVQTIVSKAAEKCVADFWRWISCQRSIYGVKPTRLLPFYLTFYKLQTNTSILFQQLCRVTLLPNFSLIGNVTLLSFRFSVFFLSFPNFLLLLPYQPQLSYAIDPWFQLLESIVKNWLSGPERPSDGLLGMRDGSVSQGGYLVKNKVGHR